MKRVVTLIGGAGNGKVVCTDRPTHRMAKHWQTPFPPMASEAPVSMVCDVEEYRIEVLRDPHGGETFVGVPMSWHNADLMDGAQDAGIISKDGTHLTVPY